MSTGLSNFFISSATILHLKNARRRRGRDRMVIGVTTTYAIGAYDVMFYGSEVVHFLVWIGFYGA
jgi:hypothetical protein